MQQDNFETKLASAGELLEKMAADRGLSMADFTEQETIDLLSTIMGDGQGGGVETPPESKTAGAAPAPTAPAPAQQPTDKTAGAQLDYGTVMAEVVKVASANGYDLSKATPEELNDAVAKMAQVMSDPQYAEKQAAFKEKLAEADAIGRVMAHAYVDELGKIAAHAHEGKETPEEERKEEEQKAEKKASLARALRAKVAGELPPQFAAHMKGKGEHGKDKDDDEHGKDDKEKKAAFEKAAGLRAAEILIANGVNPETGAKFASEQERVDAGAMLILQQKGYTA